MSLDKEKVKDTSNTSFVSGQAGAASAMRQASGTDAMIEGMDVFKKVFETSGQQKHGNLFEAIESAKFNTDSAVKGSSLKSFLTSVNGDPSCTCRYSYKRQG